MRHFPACLRYAGSGSPVVWFRSVVVPRSGRKRAAQF